MKSLVHCTHFLARNHFAHSTNFTQLVDLVVSCGAKELQVFIENASRNAAYTSQGAVVDFIEALGKWVEETRLRNGISECRLSELMKIAIESPQTLTDKYVEEIITVWNRKP